MTFWFETIHYILSYIREREASLDEKRFQTLHQKRNVINYTCPSLPP